MLFNLADRKQNFQNVGILLKEINFISMPVASIRIGCQSGDIRPLKVLLKSAADRHTVLRSAKHLNGSKSFTLYASHVFSLKTN